MWFKIQFLLPCKQNLVKSFETLRENSNKLYMLSLSQNRDNNLWTHGEFCMYFQQQREIIPKVLQYCHMKQLLQSLFVLNQWHSVCCEGECFIAVSLAKSHSLRCDSSAGQTHTHSKQLGTTVEIIIGLFSTEYESILTNKAPTLGLYLSQVISVTKS